MLKLELFFRFAELFSSSRFFSTNIHEALIVLIFDNLKINNQFLINKPKNKNNFL